MPHKLKRTKQNCYLKLVFLFILAANLSNKNSNNNCKSHHSAAAIQVTKFLTLGEIGSFAPPPPPR